MATTKPIFVNQVTHVPAYWANSVSDLLYDVFNEVKTLEDAKRRLTIGKIAQQDPANVLISGGRIDGVIIGSANPASATFTEARATNLVPMHDQSLVTKNWVEKQLAGVNKGLTFGTMGQQNSDNVYITGGSIALDRVTVRNNPILGTDSVNLNYLNAQIQALKDWIPKQIPTAPTTPVEVKKVYPCKLFQAPKPLDHCRGRKVFTTPFKFKCGNVVTFVDGVYQLPDMYAATNENTVVFFEPLPEDAVVGAFSIGAVDENGNLVGCESDVKGCSIVQGFQPFETCKNGIMVFLPFKIRTGLVLFIDGVYQLPDRYEITSPTSVRLFGAIPKGVVVSGFTV